MGGGTYVYGLAGLLAAAGALALFALYRMVAVAVSFAERRSNFAAAVSHELKTPLTAIRMYGEMLRDNLVESDAKRREYYGSITLESERLGRLIDNVLEFSRLEQGTRSLSPAVGDIGPAIEETVELDAASRRARGLHARAGSRPGPSRRALRSGRARAGAVQPGRQRGQVRTRRRGEAHRPALRGGRGARSVSRCATSAPGSPPSSSRASSSPSTGSRTR